MSSDIATPLTHFEDKLGQRVEPGDVIAYAVNTYSTTLLRVAEVVSIEEREAPNRRYWYHEKFWIRVKPKGGSPRMIHKPHRTVLLTKKESRL